MSRPLTISGIVVKGDQGKLWDWVGDRALDHQAAARHHVGEFFEEASRVLFGAARHQIDGRADICPDLSVGRHRYLEIKSIGCSRQGLIYTHRLERDRQLVRETGGQLTYVFWIHNAEAMQYRTLSSLRAALATSVKEVLVIPFEAISRACRHLRAMPCNYRATARNGKTEMEPTFAYRLPWGLLNRLAAGRGRWSPKDLSAHGHLLHGVTLRGPDLSRILPPPSLAQLRAATYMLEELDHNHLDVVLVDAPQKRHHGHRIRVAQGQNPLWYQELAASLTKARSRPRRHHRHDSDIRRYLVRGALQRLSQGNPRYGYDFMLLPYVRFYASGIAGEPCHEEQRSWA
jgi:hypothetical protein